MRVDTSRPQNAYLFFATRDDDAIQLNDHAGKREANFTKLGDKTYIGVFAEEHEAVYAELKRKLKLSGPIHWVELPPVATTV